MVQLPTRGQKLIHFPILKESISGLKTLLGKITADYGKPPIPVANIVESSYGEREIAQQFGVIEYPYMTIQLSRIALNTIGYSNELRRQGVTANSPANSSQALRVRLLPVVAEFNIVYYTQDNEEMLDFITSWILREKDARFDLQSSGLGITIKVEFNKDVSIPSMIESEGRGKYFELQLSCVMDTYIGEAELVTKITKINLSTNLLKIDSTSTVDAASVVPGDPSIIINI